jgi:integrase
MQERTGQIGDYWLSKRSGSAQWYRTWFDADARQTRRASLGTDDLQAAKLILWEWFAKYGRVGKQAAHETSLELVFVRYYQQHGEGLASAEMARVALGYWSDFFAGATVAEVTPHRQREFVAWLEARGLADGYIKRIMTVGKSALNRAWKEGEIDTVPYVIPGRDGPPREVVLTVDQSIALWNAAELPHERMYLALAYGMASRPETILDLHRSFVDFDRRLINSNPPGRRQTRKHRPVVPVGRFLLPWLEQAQEGPLVTWRGKPIDSFKTAWRKMRARAKLPRHFVAKDIRHTMATEMRAKAVPEAEINGFIGHRAYGGKTEIYAKYRPDYLGQAVAVIDGYMDALRVSCVPDPGYLPERKARKKEP